jgi:hypothetical protein
VRDLRAVPGHLRVCISTAIAALLLPGVALQAPARAADLVNGGFESGLTGWTSVGTSAFIDLGKSAANGGLEVGGCTIQDTTDYDAITLRRESGQSNPPAGDTSSYPENDDSVPDSYSGTVSAVTTGVPPGVIGTQTLRLFSDVSTLRGWDVVHGPAVYSDGFSATSGDSITLDWYAEYDSDDFAILGILLDTTDCSQVEIVDSTGTDAEDMVPAGTGSGWQRAAVSIPTTRSGDEYRFVFVSGTFDRSGGQAAGALLYIDNISVGQPQTITLDAIADQSASAGTVTATATTTAPGLAVEFSSATTSRCTVDASTGVITLVSRGTCTVSANQTGGTGTDGTKYAAATTVTRSFSITDSRLADLTVSEGTLTPTFESGIGSYSSTVATSITSLTVTPTASYSGASITVNGVSVSSGSASGEIALSEGANTITIVVTDGADSTTTTLTVTRTPSFVPPVPTSPINDPGGDLPSTPPGSTSGSVGGVPTAPTPSVPTSDTAKYEVGVVQAEVRTGGAGTVSGPTSAPVLQVVRDRVATVGGGGMAPGGIVEVWMPLPGGGSRQVALLPVGEDGSFDGALPFTGELDGNGPLPIGERTIQLYGTDANGQLTVVNVGIRVTQPGPLAPEPERAPGAPPTLTPGQSLATNAGLPTPVTVTPLPGERTTRVQGDGWLLEIDVPDGTVRNEAGNPIMEVVAGDDTEVRGTGFLPGTRAYVWIMSDPTFLGEVRIGSDGTFAGDLPVDVAPGQHTLQVSGVGTDGYVRAANLGVIVLAGDGAPRPTRVAAGEGTAPLLPLRTGTLALALAAGLGAATLTRRRTPTT